MWPLKRKLNKLLTISLTPQNITCCVIKADRFKKKRCTVCAYERTPLKHLEFAQAIPFNVSKLQKIITEFVQKNQLEQTQAAISVSGPPVFEQIVTVAQAHPQKKDFDLPELDNFNWDYLYLCPSQKNGFDFFLCGVKPHHLFSYQLLAQKCGVNLKTLTTGQLAHLYLYRFLHQDQFRQAKLSLDLLKQRYEMHALCEQQNLHDFVSVADEACDLQKESVFLKPALGLFLSERHG